MMAGWVVKEGMKNQRWGKRSFVPWDAVGGLVVDYPQQIAVLVQHLIDEQRRRFFVAVLLEERPRHEGSHGILLLGGEFLHGRPALKHGLLEVCMQVRLFGVADWVRSKLQVYRWLSSASSLCLKAPSKSVCLRPRLLTVLILP